MSDALIVLHTAIAIIVIFPAIYVDVQLVLAAPLARSAAPRMRRDGLAMMSGTLTAGILVGYVFLVPGLGTNISGGIDRATEPPIFFKRLLLVSIVYLRG